MTCAQHWVAVQADLTFLAPVTACYVSSAAYPVHLCATHCEDRSRHAVALRYCEHFPSCCYLLLSPSTRHRTLGFHYYLLIYLFHSTVRFRFVSRRQKAVTTQMVRKCLSVRNVEIGFGRGFAAVSDALSIATNEVSVDVCRLCVASCVHIVHCVARKTKF